MISRGDKYEKLCLISDIQVSSGSHQKLVWVCDCGRQTEAIVKNVTSGNTTSCGRCNEISAEKISRRKFGKLRMKNPRTIKCGSGKTEIWICDCGKEKIASIRQIVAGNTTSCGRCNEISAEEMSKRKFGKLRMKNPKIVSSGSRKKVTWTCDCGKEILIAVKYIVAGNTTSCGRCNEISAEEMSKRKFGKLRMKNPGAILSGSNKKTIWTCDCGKETVVRILSVTSGNTKSCGSCYSTAFSWWDSNKEAIRALKCPINPIDIPGKFVALRRIKTTKDRFPSLCLACERNHFSRWEMIRLGRGLTCGCSYNGSSLNTGITSLIRSTGLSVQTEYEVGGLKYDIFVPDRDLLIEMNGLKWHSIEGSRQRDLEKYQNGIKSGYKFMMIFEDEWKENRIKSVVLNAINKTRPILIRPSRCLIHFITNIEANKFHGKFHYIGRCNPLINLGVYIGGKMIACMSFGRPTRQNSKYEFELLRMSSDPSFRIHGIWSKLLSVFVKVHLPTSIVSFSDNRLFSGNVYEKMGFFMDGYVRPDYYWTDGYKRFHKSGMKKRGPEKSSGLTESEIRKSQGYRKIWDLGKKRWITNERALSDTY